jgi:hypothetical protein
MKKRKRKKPEMQIILVHEGAIISANFIPKETKVVVFLQVSEDGLESRKLIVPAYFIRRALNQDYWISQGFDADVSVEEIGLKRMPLQLEM